MSKMRVTLREQQSFINFVPIFEVSTPNTLEERNKTIPTGSKWDEASRNMNIKMFKMYGIKEHNVKISMNLEFLCHRNDNILWIRIFSVC